MSFEFQTPSIHNVQDVTAFARTVNNEFACLKITFHRDGAEQTMEAYFDKADIGRAHDVAAAINSLTVREAEAA